jgi:N-acetylglucosaminyl-diphospho-decaprenol L-rhamnosyltransferase
MPMLRACLQSLQDQPQGVALEVIVVDNASTDGAPEMVEREFPEVLLVRNPDNRGFSRANNQAARMARGRYVFFLNNDTIAPALALGRLVDYADRHPEIGMLGPRLRDGQGQFQVSYRQRPGIPALLHKNTLFRCTGLFKRAYRHYRRREFDPHSCRAVDVLMGAAVLLPREKFIQWGAWDEDFAFGGEDLELSARVNRAAAVVYLPQVEILHYGRVSSRRMIGFASTQMAVGLVQYLRKVGYGPLTITFYKAIVLLDAPIQFACKLTQMLWRRLQGRKTEAERSRLAVVGCAHFLTRGLIRFLTA